MTEAVGWDWIARYTSLGFCLTLVRGRTPDQILATFGVDVTTAERLTMAEAAAEFSTQSPVVRSGTMAGWGFAFEEFGGITTDDQLLLDLSTGTALLSVCRLANAAARFGYAEDGDWTTTFDPLAPGDRGGSRTDRLVAEMRQVGLDPEGQPPDPARINTTRAMLDLATLISGVSLDAATVEGALLCGEVEPDVSWLEEPDR